MYLPLISNYDPVLRNWLNKLSFSPSTPVCKDLQELILGLRNDGDLIKLDLFHVIGGLETDNQRLTPLISTANVAFSSVNSPTLDSTGVTGNGTNSWINLNWNVTNHGSNFSQNSASFGFYCRTDSTEANGIAMGGDASKSYVYLKRSAGGNVITRINTSSDFSTSSINPDSRGFYSMNRSSSTTSMFYRNGVAIQNGASTSTAVGATTWGLCSNAGGDFSARNYSSVHLGSGDINNVAFYNRIQTYMTRRGINV